MAQFRNLVVDELLDDLARTLDRLIALQHEIEVEIVDQREEQPRLRLVSPEYLRQPG